MEKQKFKILSLIFKKKIFHYFNPSSDFHFEKKNVTLTFKTKKNHFQISVIKIN